MKGMLIVLGVIVLMGAADCAEQGGSAVRGIKRFNAKIILKYDETAGQCFARTVPRHIEFEPGDNDSFTWTIRDDKNRCLPSGVDLEFRFTAGNPTACASLSTNAGNKTRIECDLGTYTVNRSYKYDLYLVGTGMGTGKKAEDPDIEIVQF